MKGGRLTATSLASLSGGYHCEPEELSSIDGTDQSVLDFRR